ncbi:MAG: hypothetical protein AAGG51_11350 [Cyanobacteria bacterium P01_G01_bin.54]
MTNNTETLTELHRTIDLGQGQFSLLLVRCNDPQLRDRLLMQLGQTLIDDLALTLATVHLDARETNLYQRLQTTYGAAPPPVIAVVGFEQLQQPEELLWRLNQSRSQMAALTQSFPVPLLLWADDEMVQLMWRCMPDFMSWAATFHFDLETAELELRLQAIATRHLEAIVAREQLSPQFDLLSPTDFRVARLARKELERRDAELAPEVKGAIALAEGSQRFAQPDQLDDALQQFQTSLTHWQTAENLLGQAIAQFYISQCHGQQEDWQAAKTLREAALADLAAAERPDLATRFCNQMGEVWVALGDWERLRSALPEWQQHHVNMPHLLAMDLSWAAQLAEHEQDWTQMEALVERAIALYTEAGERPPLEYFLQKGRAIAAQGELGRAIATLETTRQQTPPETDPVGYVALLRQLQQFYCDDQQYQAAFQIKQARRSVQFRFKLRAFLGAGRLQVREEGGDRDAGAQSMALGREQDIQTLVTERIGADRNSLTVLCGMSGVGKSSLVEAGLIPALQGKIYLQKYRALTVLVRVYSDWVSELGQALQAALTATYPEILLPEPLETVAALKAQLQHNASRNLLTVLMFDQFEEFFFVCKEPETRRGFYRFLADCLERKAIQYTTVILSIREDYLHELLAFEDYLHELVERGEASLALKRDFLGREQRQRIENFTVAVAQDVMTQLCAASALRMEPELIAAVIEDLANALGRVRPVELQVVGAQLEAREIATVAAYRALGANPKLALAEEWVEDIVRDCGPALRGVVWKLLMALTNERGTRPLLTSNDLATELENFGKVSPLPAVDLERDILEILVGSGLVVRLPQEPEVQFQLVHDYLVGVIRRRYNRDYQRQFEDLLVKARREEAQRKKVERQFLVGALAASVVFAGLASFTGFLAYQSHRAEQRAKVGELIAQSAWMQDSVSNEWGTLLATETHEMIQNNKIQNVSLGELDAVLRQGLPRLPTTVANLQHNSGVTSVAFSPDGKYLVTGSWDKTARVFHTETWKELTRIQHDSGVLSTVFSPDGKYVLAQTLSNIAEIAGTETGEEVARIQHKNQVSSVSFGPDGKYVLTGSWDKTAKISRTETGEEIARIQYGDAIKLAVFSPDGKYVILGGGWKNKTAKIFHTETGKEVTKVQYYNSISSVAFSPNGQYVVTGSEDGTARISHTETGEEVTRIQHEIGINLVAFSPNEEHVLTVSLNGIAKISRIETGEEITRIQNEFGIDSVDFSPDGEYILIGSYGGTAKVFHTEIGEEIVNIQHDSWVRDVTFSPDGKYVVTASSDRTTKISHATPIKELNYIQHGNNINSVAFSPNGKYIVTASSDYIAKISHTKTGKEVTRIQHDNWITSAVFSANGKYVATGGRDNTAKISHVKTGEEVTRIQHNEPINSVAFSPNGKYIVTASDDKTAKISYAETGEEVFLIQHDLEVYTAQFSPNGKYVITGSNDGDSKILQIDTGNEIAHIQHDISVSSVAFSPNGKYVITASRPTKILYTETGEELVNIEHDDWVNIVAFSPDGKYVLTGDFDNTARIFYAKTGEEVARMQHDNRITSASFSPDSKYIATGSSDHTARISRTDTGEEIARIQHENWVTSVAFSPNGKYILTGSYDDTALISPVQTNSFVEAVCQHTQKNLSAEVWQRYIDPNLVNYRRTCPDNPIHPTVIRTALYFVAEDNIRQARAILKRVHYLDPFADLFPDTKEIENNPEIAIQKQKATLQVKAGTKYTQKNEIKKAFVAYKKAIDIDPDVDFKPYLNLIPNLNFPGSSINLVGNDWERLCWFGISYKRAEGFLPACNNAVELNPTDGQRRTSRGIARALTGDTEGAIADFQAYIDWQGSSESRKQQRRDWIAALKRGENPFTEAVLEELREE